MIIVFIIMSLVLFLFMGCIWDDKNTFNIFLKFTWFAMLIFGVVCLLQELGFHK